MTTEQPQNIQPVEHLTVDERVARGRAARAEVPRSSLATLEPPADRDPVATLEEQAVTRVPELVPIRYGRMLATPFAFYRGGAAIMAKDLCPAPSTGLRVQLVGDAHLANFGGYASPERNFVFDVNDFDETLRGPFELDVKRFAASVEVAGRWTGLSAAKCRAVVLSTVRAYRDAMREFAALGNLDVWYARADVTTIMKGLPGRRDRHTLERDVEHAQTNSTAHDLESLLYDADGRLRFKPKPPLVIPVEELLEGHPDRIDHLRDIFRAYRRSLPYERRRLLEGYRYAHLARKVVGVGSVGLRSWIMLVLGRDDGDPLILQLKEASESVLEPYLGRAPQATHAQRVVEGQRLDQAASDIFLGWTRVEDERGVARDYYVRQLRDWKLSIDIGTLTERGLTTYAGWCAWSLARAHARSGDRIAIASYLGGGAQFDRAVAEFSSAYADLNERDHAALAAAVQDGRIVAAEGV
jgi:uncharacterized protein (DUF2252 family)